MIAVHEIQRPAENGKTQVVNPGDRFNAADQDQFEHLEKAGAARKFHDVEQGDEDQGQNLDWEDLSKKTNKQLQEMLAAKGIEFDPAANKAALIALLTPADDSMV